MRGYVDNQITTITGGAPAILDTLGELANALGADANLSVTITSQIANVNANITTANLGMRGYVDSQSFYSNVKVATYLPTYDGNIAANISKAGYTWTFGTNGALTLPAGGANANQALLIYPTGNAEGDHVHLTAGGGSTELYLGNDFHYVKLVDGGNIELRSATANLSAQAAWTFETDGELDTIRTLGIKVPNGVPTDVAVINSTSGSWEANPNLSLATTGGSGSGLTVNVSEVGGYASTIEIATAGTGYNNGDLITVTSGTSNATFTIVIAGRNTWTFGIDGNLTLPNGAVLRNLANSAIAFGQSAGANNSQGATAIAIGTDAGYYTQGAGAVAIGESAGESYQGANAVAIGKKAGYYYQAANSIILNATGDPLEQTTTSTFTVKPVRQANTANAMYYNTSTGEITYDTAGGGTSIPAVVTTGAVGVGGQAHVKVQFTVASDTTVTAVGVTVIGISNPASGQITLSGSPGTGSFDIVAATNVQSQTFILMPFATNASGTGYGAPIAGTGTDPCLVRGTMITMADMSRVAVENITYNDDILVWDFDLGEFASAKPVWIKKTQTAVVSCLLTFSDDSELRIVGDSPKAHRIFNKEAGKFTYGSMPETPIGTTTFNDQGEEITLISKEWIVG